MPLDQDITRLLCGSGPVNALGIEQVWSLDLSRPMGSDSPGHVNTLGSKKGIGFQIPLGRGLDQTGLNLLSTPFQGTSDLDLQCR